MRLFVRINAIAILTIGCNLIVPDLRAGTALYDPAIGGLPIDQGWISFIDGSSLEHFDGAQVSLNTTANRADRSGYFSEDPPFGLFSHPKIPVLDRISGFTIRFDVQVIVEGHNLRDDNADGLYDRAGFSVITISEDLSGIELGFFDDLIWAYAAAEEGLNSQFTQAEGIAFDTTSGMVTYDLAVSHDTYTLYGNGRNLFGGPLRNYNPSGLGALVDPYDNPSFLFFGDDTTSADSHVVLGRIEVLSTIGLGLADVNRDGIVDAGDIDRLIAAIFEMETDPIFDMNRDGQVDQEDRVAWIRELQHTWIGDSNLDGEFNSNDLIGVFGAGEYEDAVERNSSWSSGDWDGNREFESSDLIAAFQDGGYEKGPRERLNGVPEPTPFVVLATALIGLTFLRRGQRCAGFVPAKPV